MSITAPATHTLGTQTTTYLQRGVAIAATADLEGILRRARLAELNTQRTDEGLTPLSEEEFTALEAAPRRGPRAKFTAYTATALFAALYEVKASGASLSLKAMLDAFWTRYSTVELTLIGMGSLRDPQRYAAMFPITSHLTEADKNRAVTEGARLYEAEYQRLVVAFDAAFAVMDDTPLKMPKSAPGAPARRPTKAQVAAAAKNAALVPKRAAKLEVLNAIIAASLKVANFDRYPHHDVFTGILADHKGAVAVDETHIIDALGSGLSAQTAPGNYNARLHGHTREGGKDGHRVAVGLTLAVATADPGQDHNVPEVCLGASIHNPTGGQGDAVRDIVRGVTANGLRPSARSNAVERWVFDGGYPERDHLNRDLTVAGISMVFKSAKNRTVHFELGGVNNPDGTYAPGVNLFNGVLLCPGASRRRLEELAKRFTKPDEARMSDEQLLAHAATLAELEPLRMRTNGRPQLTVLRKRGGQRKDAPARAPEEVMKVTATCPFAAGTARCGLFAEANDAEYAHLPEVPEPPHHLDPALRPACCRNENGSMVVNLPMDAYKTYQHDLMVGSFEHADWYTGPRSANERFNSLLKSAHGGTDLSRRAIAPRKAAFYALALAASIAVTNVNVLETFDAKVARRGGVVTPPPGKENKRARARRLRDAHDARNPRRIAA